MPVTFFSLCFWRRLACPCLAVFLLAGCAQTNLVSHYAKKLPYPGEATSQGAYKVGTPYVIAGQRYHPREDFNLVETGIASWYGPGFHGKRTANGEIYDKNELTAAHRTLQMPSIVRVTNLENGRSIVVRVNDRGPFKKGRVIDVSKRSAELLGFINQGTARVRIEVLEAESRKIAAVAKQGGDTSRVTLADLNRAAPAPARAEPVRVAASRQEDDLLPESLRRPTITVEELNRDQAPGRYSSQAGARAVIPSGSRTAGAFRGHVDNSGRVMPDDVVEVQPVVPTQLFVQAGSFSVEDNARRLSRTLAEIAPTIVEPVDVSGRTFYRVKLGPIANVAEADAVLNRVVSAGSGDARVVQAR